MFLRLVYAIVLQEMLQKGLDGDRTPMVVDGKGKTHLRRVRGRRVKDWFCDPKSAKTALVMDAAESASVLQISKIAFEVESIGEWRMTYLRLRALASTSFEALISQMVFRDGGWWVEPRELMLVCSG